MLRLPHPLFSKNYLAVGFLVFLAGCGGGSGRDAADTTPRPTPTPPPSQACTTPEPDTTPLNPAADVTISGFITYEYVPHRDTNGALDYLAAEPRPVRGATVQLLNANGEVLRETRTDSNGQYSLGAPENTDVRVRVLAEIKSSQGAHYWFRVTDNTDGNILYALDGSLISSGTVDSGRDLFAPAGWDESTNEYVATRTAAPFAILDSLYTAVDLLTAVDPTIDLCYAEVRWSVDNRAVSGEPSMGEIGTSSYFPNENAIYVLGHADNDTDEYDPSVIVHELAHYLEHTIWRADNIGGNHSIIEDFLDPRVAMSEGWGNAFSGIVLDTEFYVDSAGQGQSIASRFSLETNAFDSQGWYNENAVQQILFDIFDQNNENADDVSLGYAPIHAAMTSPSFRQSSAFNTIYLFIDELKKVTNSEIEAEINNLMESHSIFGTGPFGENETNDGGLDRNLPVYRRLSLGENISFCTGNPYGEYNKLDNREFFLLPIDQAGMRELQLSFLNRTGGNANGTVVVYFAGDVVEVIDFSASSSVTRMFNPASAGDYVLEYYEDQNIDDSGSGGTICSSITIN